MKLLFTTLAAILLLCPLANHAQATTEPEAIPFHFTSFNTPFAMQGDFEGEYRVYPTSIEINLTKAVIRISEHCPYKGRREFAALTFTLATHPPGGGWKMAFKSQQFFLNRIMIPRDEFSFGPVQFSIPRDEKTELSNYWLVAQMEDNALDDPRERHVTGYAFAHSCQDIFVQKNQEPQ